MSMRSFIHANGEESDRREVRVQSFYMLGIGEHGQSSLQAAQSFDEQKIARTKQNTRGSLIGNP